MESRSQFRSAGQGAGVPSRAPAPGHAYEFGTWREVPSAGVVRSARTIPVRRKGGG